MVFFNQATRTETIGKRGLAAGKGIEAAKLDELLILRGSAFDHVVRPILTKEQIAFLKSIERSKVVDHYGQPLNRYSFGW